MSSIGFIGAGNLAKAVTRGILGSGYASANKIWGTDTIPEALQWMDHLGCNTTLDTETLVKENKRLILITKPQTIPEVISTIRPHLTKDHLLLSFAAGLKLDFMQSLLPADTRLGRVMTNTSVQYLEGVSAYTLTNHCTDDDRQFLHELTTSIGYSAEVKEDNMDIITSFVGGGPAFTYVFIEAMADGAVLGGMRRDEAIRMAAKTVLGAAKTLKETGLHPGELKDLICSAGGTTINGIRQLEKAGFRSSVIEAVKGAADRAQEISKS